MLVYPGITAGIVSQYNILNNGSWMPIILVTEYNIGDYIGRLIFASRTSFGFNAKTLWIACALRIIFYPIYVLIYKGVIINDIFTNIINLIFTITNGHFVCLSFIYAPQLVEPYEREICGAIMMCALVFGIFAGSGVGLLIGIVL